MGCWNRTRLAVPSPNKHVEAARKIRAQAKRLRAMAKMTRYIIQRRYPKPTLHPISISEAKAESENARRAARELQDQERAEKLTTMRKRGGVPEMLLPCPHCGYQNTAAEIIRLDSERIQCAKCRRVDRKRIGQFIPEGQRVKRISRSGSS
jgi:hypothetical protein